MSRPLRDITPEKVHLLTCRTRNSEILFVPRPKITNCIGGVIAKYAKKYDISLYAVIVLGNHYHILASSKDGKLPLFAENIGREIAKRVNRLLKRKGSLWGRRYDDQLVIEKYDALEGLLYTLTNPTKHKLLAHSKLWPGLSTYKQSIGGKPQKYTFFKHSAYSKAKRLASIDEIVRKSDFEEQHLLKIKPIPLHENLSAEHRNELLNNELEKRTRKLCREIRAAGGSFMGRKKVINQKITGQYPKDSNKSNRPLCYTKSVEALKLFKEKYYAFLATYKEASRRYRLGLKNVEFPPNCFLPPSHHIPQGYNFQHS